MQALDNVCNKHFTLLMMGERGLLSLLYHTAHEAQIGGTTISDAL